MSSSEPPPEQPHVSYYWNDVLEWERQAKAEAEAKLAQQAKEEEKEQTKSAAAKDLLEALQEEQILDDLEIKQEIVLDPNEWVLLGFYWIVAEFLMRFLLSDFHSQPRAKRKLRDHSSATFAEKLFLKNGEFDSMFKIMPNLQCMNAAFVQNLSN